MAPDLPSWPERLLALPGIADGDITEDDLASVSWVWSIAREHGTLSELVIGLSWIRDGVKQGDRGKEGEVLGRISAVTFLDPALAERVAGLPWVVDGVTEAEGQSIEYLLEAVRKGIFLARRIAELPLLENGLTQAELAEIQAIRERFLEEFSARLSYLPWVADGPPRMRPLRPANC